MCTESSQRISFAQCRGLGLETLLVTRPGMISTWASRAGYLCNQCRSGTWTGPGLFSVENFTV